MMFQKTYIETPLHSIVPAEKKGSLVFGVLSHFGPALIFCIATAAGRFGWMGMMLGFLGASLLGLPLVLWAEHTAPCIPMQSSKESFTKGMIVIFFDGMGLGSIAVLLAGWVSQKLFLTYQPGARDSWSKIVVALALTDLGYYALHRFLGHSSAGGPVTKWFRKVHLPHHSVEALDFLRGNAGARIESVTTIQIALVIVGTLLDLPLTSQLIVYIAYLFLQTTHHANHTFNIGGLSYVFVDSHSHKMHHCTRGTLVNFGLIFSIWDRLFGTYYENWQLSPNYMELHRIKLPIQRNPHRACMD